MVCAHPLDHRPDEFLSKAGRYAFFWRITLVDQQKEQLVHLGIGKTQLAFIVCPSHRSAEGGLATISSGTPIARESWRTWVLYRSPNGFRAQARVAE